MPNWLAATLSVLAGGILTMLTNWIADHRLGERERERRREEQKERRAVRRDDFQRETLLALQVASQKLCRTAGAIHHQDVMAFRRTRQWQRQLLADDLSNGQSELNVETMLLASRVRDERVRVSAKQLRDRVLSVGHSPNENAADAQLVAGAHIQEALIERIGHLIRELDELH